MAIAARDNYLRHFHLAGQNCLGAVLLLLLVLLFKIALNNNDSAAND